MPCSRRLFPPLSQFARQLFPGQVPTKLVSPEPYEGDTFTLEGHELRIIEQGRTDCPDSTSLHVSSIGLIVAGDVVYNQCRMYVGDTTPESRKNWIAALDRLAALNPAIVVSGDKKPERPTLPRRSLSPSRCCLRLRHKGKRRPSSRYEHNL
jgi:glyoxylase-like metal-dependent hydrolase (beta-lactamase superfamily II)